MKNILLIVVIMSITISNIAQNERVTSIDKLLSKPATIVQLEDKKTVSIDNNQNMIIRKYIDVTHDESYEVLYFFGCTFEMSEIPSLENFFKLCVAQEIDPNKKEPFTLKYQGVGNYNILYTKASPTYSLLFVEINGMKSTVKVKVEDAYAAIKAIQE